MQRKRTVSSKRNKIEFFTTKYIKDLNKILLKCASFVLYNSKIQIVPQN